MNNIPEVKTGIVGVSRDCFVIELSRERKNRVVEECKKQSIPVTGCETVVENERDVLKALNELREKGINTLVIYLGNFGPEGPLSLLARKFDGPVMLCAAAEESAGVLVSDRGDAYCGMLNASYNCSLRNLSVHIPEYPVGIASEVAGMIGDFIPVARVVLGLKKLKIFSFGPRPQDFLACNAPIKPLYDLGVEIMENSELDLYDIFREAENDPDIEAVAEDMARELGEGNIYTDLLPKLAQYECALMKFLRQTKVHPNMVYLQINAGLLLKSILNLFHVMSIPGSQAAGCRFHARWIFMAHSVNIWWLQQQTFPQRFSI